MTRPPTRPLRHVAVIQLIPNMLTIAALCAGLTAIRVAVQGSFSQAVLLIMVACILDGLDGRVARLLRSDSPMGAELDSLVDFVNFGVAPALVLYFWALRDMGGLGWIAVLLYAVCCVMRLARFNIDARRGSDCASSPASADFVGVPSPAGAILVLLPLYIAFAFSEAPQLPDTVIWAHMVIVGLAMISTIRTRSFKTVRISRENVKLLLVGFAVVAAAALTYFWMVMIALSLGYLALVVHGSLAMVRQTDRKGD